jgi:hypothetical protein
MDAVWLLRCAIRLSVQYYATGCIIAVHMMHRLSKFKGVFPFADISKGK